MPALGVLGQNVLLFTVQIRRLGGDRPVGTGFIVSPGGLVATCRHVVRDAGVDPRTGTALQSWIGLALGRSGSGDGAVSVCLPTVQQDGVHRRERTYRALLHATPHPFSDDVVLLQIEDPPPLTDQEVATLGIATGSERHQFVTFGYRQRDEHRNGLSGDGLITSLEGAAPAFRAEPGELLRPELELRCPEIKAGMSGAPVLDVVRNLVVGVVAREFDSGKEGKDHDLAFAVDSAVVADDRFRAVSGVQIGVPVHRKSLPLAPGLPNDITLKLDDVCDPSPGTGLHGAAEASDEWLERRSLAAALRSAWDDGAVRVLGLVGFGGSGKSALARRLVDAVGAEADGVFWWNFNSNPNPDAFFDAAMRHFTVDGADLSRYDSSVLRGRLLARLLEGGRHLVVLDGLESAQHTAGDAYGAIVDPALRHFLQFIAAPTHRSLCLVTSRAPIVDLVRYVQTYREREVDGLRTDEGVALLRQFDETLPDALVRRIVDEWQGHPLSLVLIGARLRQLRGARGQNAILPHQIPRPTVGASQDLRVASLLRSYDDALDDAERALLTTVSLFRGGARADDAAAAYAALRAREAAPAELEAEFEAVSGELVRRRLVQRAGDRYMAHPIVADHFRERLWVMRRELATRVHGRIADRYLARAVPPSPRPDLPELTEWVEAVYHLCRSERFDEAYATYQERLEQGDAMVLSWHLNAYATLAEILEPFFPGGDTTADPLLSEADHQRYVVNRLGVCRMNLGRLGEASALFQHAVRLARRHRLVRAQLHSTENLVEVSLNLGDLESGRDDAENAVALARRLDDPAELRDALAYLGFMASLVGDMEGADRAFRDAEAVAEAANRDVPHLESLYGIWHADHRLHTGDLDRAETLTRRLLARAESEDMRDDVSQCWRLLGDVAARRGDDQAAEHAYATAVRTAREISETTVLLEALSARGAWAASLGRDDAAATVREALHYALGGGYRLLHVDLRLSLARIRAHLRELDAARREAESAARDAEAMHYHWGRLDALAFLRQLDAAPPSRASEPV